MNVEIGATPRITWKRDSDSLEVGCIGRINLFTLTDYSTEERPQWALRTKLPTKVVMWKRADPQKLKRHAETLLATFVAELGAVFPADASEEG